MKKGAAALLSGAERQSALELMVRYAADGGVIIVGTNKPLEIGVPVGHVGEDYLMVVRRATREEFLQHAPMVFHADQPRTAFYWQLDVVRK